MPLFAFCLPQIMNNFMNLFGRSKHVIIGMVHVRALPGSPLGCLNMDQIREVACSEADIYNRAGVDAIMIENMFDVPWLRHDLMGPETTACMSCVCSAVRSQHPALPMGVQILAGANKEALAVAKAAGLNFIRAEGFVFSHIADKGPIHSCGAELLRYRHYLEAENVLVFTDIKKKHSSHAITSDVSLQETARAAALFQSDGVIVTGLATGAETNPQEVSDVQDAVNIPVLVGSGVTTDNLSQYASADGIIIGSHLKVEGQWQNDLDETRVKRFMEKVNDIRNLALQSASSNNVSRTDIE